MENNLSHAVTDEAPPLVEFEYTARVTSNSTGHWPKHNEKGSREWLPRDVALRKQQQGIGHLVGRDVPVATTAADLTNHDPLAPREPVA